MRRRKARIQQQKHKACEVSTLIDHKSKKEEGKISLKKVSDKTHIRGSACDMLIG